MHRYFKRKANQKKANKKEAEALPPPAIYINVHRQNKEDIEKVIGSSADTFGKFDILTTDDIKREDGGDCNQSGVEDSLQARPEKRVLVVTAIIFGLAAVGGAALWIKAAF